MDLNNFDCETQMLNSLPDFEVNQDEFEKMLQHFNEEEFTKQISKLDDESTQTLKKKRRKQDFTRKGPSNKILGETSSQTATTKMENNCIDICQPTYTSPSLPKTDVIDTKGLLKIGKVCLNGEGKRVPSFEVNFKNEGDVYKLKYLLHQWFDEEVKADDVDLGCARTSPQMDNISCDIEWIREDKLLQELLGIIYKYKYVGGFGRIKHLKKSLFAFVKFSDNKWNVYKCTNIINLK